MEAMEPVTLVGVMADRVATIQAGAGRAATLGRQVIARSTIHLGEADGVICTGLNSGKCD